MATNSFVVFRNRSNCINCTSSTTENCFTQQELAMRQKAEVLKHNQNSSNLTKKQKLSQMARGIKTYSRKTWGTQGVTTTNPNIYNLERKNNTLIQKNCNINKPRYFSSSSSGVPGNQLLVLDNNVPLTSLILNRRTGSSGGGIFHVSPYFAEPTFMPIQTVFPPFLNYHKYNEVIENQNIMGSLGISGENCIRGAPLNIVDSSVNTQFYNYNDFNQNLNHNVTFAERFPPESETELSPDTETNSIADIDVQKEEQLNTNHFLNNNQQQQQQQQQQEQEQQQQQEQEQQQEQQQEQEQQQQQQEQEQANFFLQMTPVEMAEYKIELANKQIEQAEAVARNAHLEAEKAQREIDYITHINASRASANAAYQAHRAAQAANIASVTANNIVVYTTNRILAEAREIAKIRMYSAAYQAKVAALHAYNSFRKATISYQLAVSNNIKKVVKASAKQAALAAEYANKAALASLYSVVEAGVNCEKNATIANKRNTANIIKMKKNSEIAKITALKKLESEQLNSFKCIENIKLEAEKAKKLAEIEKRKAIEKAKVLIQKTKEAAEAEVQETQQLFNKKALENEKAKRKAIEKAKVLIQKTKEAAEAEVQETQQLFNKKALENEKAKRKVIEQTKVNLILNRKI